MFWRVINLITVAITPINLWYVVRSVREFAARKRLAALRKEHDSLQREHDWTVRSHRLLVEQHEQLIQRLEGRR
jgi:hypothetical protein